MSFKTNEHVGKTLAAFDIHGGCSPCFQVIVPKGTNFKEMAEQLQEAILTAIRRIVGDDIHWSLDEPLLVDVHPRSGVMQSVEDRLSVFKELQDEIGTQLEESRKASEKQMESDPNNGTEGWWLVEGIRHSAHCKADSALKAVAKAKNVVQDWEVPIATFIGVDLPEVF